MFLGQATEGVKDALVAALGADLRGRVLGLQDELDTLNGRHHGLGNAARNTTQHEVAEERVRNFLRLPHLGRVVVGHGHGRRYSSCSSRHW